jgi:inhibitor of KinA sporulation pathway (predicted exonuclease)
VAARAPRARPRPPPPHSQVTTIRVDGAYTDGRRPDGVAFATRLADDLARRDFTVNAAAVDVSSRTLLDPHGGAADAAAGVLRMVGDADARLVDDGLRVWRAYRFLDAGARGVRSVDPALAAALASPAAQAAAAKVSRERVWEELAKILVGQNAPAVLGVMAAHGALARAVPGAPDAGPASRGVRAQAHLLHAWRRFHERARARGFSTHAGAGVAADAGAAPPPAPAAPAFLLALDLEATCDATNSPQPQELIEVGAVLLDGATSTPVAEFHAHARPTLHPVLTPFCVQFTGVSQADVDAAGDMRAVVGELTDWLVSRGALPSASAAPPSLLPVTVGDWDLDTLLPRQAAAMGVELPAWTRAWCDAQVLCREHYLRPRSSLLTMLGDLGLPHAGRPHAALDDARALSALLGRAVGDGAVPEVTRSVDGRVAAYAGDAPDLALARLALLLAGSDAATASAAARALRLGRHEARRLTRAVAALDRLPDGSDPGAARLFRASMGNQLSLQLLLEATLAEEMEGEMGAAAAGARVEAFVDAWRALPPLRSPMAAGCLLDGQALMAATGLKPGKTLGRLKEWLWRVQVERDLATAAEVAALLDELPWRGTDEGEWPRLDVM